MSRFGLSLCRFEWFSDGELWITHTQAVTPLALSTITRPLSKNHFYVNNFLSWGGKDLPRQLTFTLTRIVTLQQSDFTQIRYYFTTPQQKKLLFVKEPTSSQSIISFSERKFNKYILHKSTDQCKLLPSHFTFFLILF